MFAQTGAGLLYGSRLNTELLFNTAGLLPHTVKLSHCVDTCSCIYTVMCWRPFCENEDPLRWLDFLLLHPVILHNSEPNASDQHTAEASNHM